MTEPARHGTGSTVIQPYQDGPAMLHALALRLTATARATIEDAGIYRNCLTCIHFIEHMEHCEVFSARPPARIIAYGCNRHGDAMPF